MGLTISSTKDSRHSTCLASHLQPHIANQEINMEFLEKSVEEVHVGRREVC